MSKIHATALIDLKAQLASGVEVGPYSVIGPHVKIGKDTRIAGHVTIDGHTELGERCAVYSYACLGTTPQVRRPPVKSYLKVGDDNTIREYVTMNPGMHEEGATVVGSKNFLMMNVHVAHDCRLGDQVTVANGVALAGHVLVEDHATIGGLSGVHQYVRIGRYAMIGGLSKAVTDIPPFSTCNGNPASFYGINVLGLKRAGFDSSERLLIRKVLKNLLASGKRLSAAIAETEKEFPSDAHIKTILDFLKNSKRGVVRARSILREDEEVHAG